MVPKIDFFPSFLEVFFEPSFLIVFLRIFDVFEMSEMVKIMLPCRRELKFHKIAFFADDGKRSPKINEKSMDFEIENRENSLKKRS